MHFLCDVERLEGMLVDDPVRTFSCKDTVPIMMLLVDTSALGAVDVVVAGELAEVCADNLRRGDTVTCRGVVHNATVVATDVRYDRQRRPRSVRHRRIVTDRRRRCTRPVWPCLLRRGIGPLPPGRQPTGGHRDREAPKPGRAGRAGLPRLSRRLHRRAWPVVLGPAVGSPGRWPGRGAHLPGPRRHENGVAMARQNGGRNYPPDPDLREALRVLRRGLGKDQVIVLATIRHNDPVAKARVAAPYAQTCLELEVDVGAAGGLSAGRARRAGQRIDLQA